MKKLISILTFSLLLIVLFGALYPVMIWGVAQFAPNQGKGETIQVKGKTVGYKNLGQNFDQPNYFWGRPSAIDYKTDGSAGSNKGPTNPDYLKQEKERLDHFLKAHPYLKKGDVPSELITASGSGLDPDITPQGALIQVKRIAKARNLSEEKIIQLVKSKINQTKLIGTPTVNVLELNIALDQLK